MSKKRYFKLNDKAFSFTDTASGLQLRPGMVGEVDEKLFKRSRVAKDALKNGYILEVSKSGDIEEGSNTSSTSTTTKKKKKKKPVE